VPLLCLRRPIAFNRRQYRRERLGIRNARIRRLAAADAVGGTIAKLSGYSPHNRRGTPVSREGGAEGKQKPKEPTFSARWGRRFSNRANLHYEEKAPDAVEKIGVLRA
jgi:hypothetical protein